MKLRLLNCVLKNSGKEILTLSWLSVKDWIKLSRIFFYHLFIIFKLLALRRPSLHLWKVKLEWLHRINNSLAAIIFHLILNTF